MSNRLWTSWIWSALFLVLVQPPSVAAQCQGWTNDFSSPGVNDWVRASVVFDDGTGPALYIAGTFVYADGRPANHVARWNGVDWSALGSSPIGGGVDREVRALAVFDDGHGAALYAGGYFLSAGGVRAASIAKWDGVSWQAVGGGITGPGGLVDSLAVFDDGHGPALYAGGEFVTEGGAPAKNIAKWDGSHWSALGSGLTPAYGVASVYSMTAFDDGSGPALYIGGAFMAVDGTPAKFIARWNGTHWSPVGSGPRGFCSALAVFDDGHGPALYAGGGFGSESEHAFYSFAKWTGSTWQPLGPTGEQVFAQSFGVHQDGSGAALYVGFRRNQSGAVNPCAVGRWDGTHWTTIATGEIEPPSTFVSFDDGTGGALYVGGRFTRIGEAVASRIARWKGGSWSAVGTAPGVGGTDGPVYALQVFDDGSGPALIAGGNFLNAGGVSANHVAKWNGVGWRNLGEGTSTTVKALAVFDDGTGPALFAGGDFWNSHAVHSVAKWNGSTWVSLDDASLLGDVHVLAVFDDGHGPELYAGGSFYLVHHGQYSYDQLAKWNGTRWIGIGGQIPLGGVDTLASFDDGQGPALYVGGNFATSGAAYFLAKWDGTTLSSVDNNYSFSAVVKALTVFDDGTGPALYVGGQMNANSTRMFGIARWNGLQWTSLQSGLQGMVQALIGFDDGSGPALFAGGTIWGGDYSYAFKSQGLARWDGSAWSVVGDGFSVHETKSISASAVFDAGDGPELFVAGDFTMAGDTPSSYIARRCVH